MGTSRKMRPVHTFCLCFLLAFNLVQFSQGQPFEAREDQKVIPNNLQDESLFEGDIILPNFRNAHSWESRRWPMGTIPYTISDGYIFISRNIILRAMKDLEEKTKVNGKSCIRFIKWSPSMVNGDRINILPGKGCKLDRDDYVTIHWENIKERMEHDFRKTSESSISHQGLPYDYGSLMHYSEKEFGVWGIFGSKKTITPKKKGAKIGQRSGPSPQDIKEIQLMYKCI